MATSTRYNRALEEHTVVDTDVHLRIPLEEVAKYVDEPYKRRVELGQVPKDSWDRYKSGRIDKRPVHTAEGMREGLCEQFSVDHPIINPSFPGQPQIPEGDYAHAILQGYNDYLIEHLLDEDEDFFGLAQIATQTPDKAAEEIDRVASEPGIVGIYVIPMGTEVPIGDPRYDPIYRAAEDNGVTIAFHPHGTVSAVDFPKQYYGFNKYISVHTLGFVWGQMQAVVSLIEQGVPVKFPDLNFAFLEGDIGWVPGLMFRLNKEYSARRDELPLLEKQPEEYIKEFYFASQPIGEPMDGRDMYHLLDAIDAPNTVMFSSDYPHWDFDNPSDLFGYIDSNCSEAERRRILSGNAIDAFDLPIRP